MNWGKSIVVAFVLFAAFIGILVTVCMREDVSLVSRDYYQNELVYQKTIDRMAHTAMLAEKPSISIADHMIRITYADFPSVQNGTLQLFRPSDAKEDRQFPLKKTDQTSLQFSTAGMKTGMYRARLHWTMNGQEFYLERIINL